MPNVVPAWIVNDTAETGLIRAVRSIDVSLDKAVYRFDVLIKSRPDGNFANGGITQLHWEDETPMEADDIKSYIHGELSEKYPDGYELLPWKSADLPGRMYGWVKIL